MNSVHYEHDKQIGRTGRHAEPNTMTTTFWDSTNNFYKPNNSRRHPQAVCIDIVLISRNCKQWQFGTPQYKSPYVYRLLLDNYTRYAAVFKAVARIFVREGDSPSLPGGPLPHYQLGLGECCKLPQRGPGQSPGRKCIFAAQKRIWWQQFRRLVPVCVHLHKLLYYINKYNTCWKKHFFNISGGWSRNPPPLKYGPVSVKLGQNIFL